MNLIGIDLGGTNIAVGLVDETGKIHHKSTTPTLAHRAPEAIIDDMAKCCFEVCEKAGIKMEDVDFCGIASPGICNSKTGVVERAENLPFNGYPVVEELSKRIGVKNIGIENDANAAAKGEAEVGAAKGYANSVMITLGTGVGGGIIIDHKVYSGFNFAGAELGHMVIVKDGRDCTCKEKGCWETYSSATGLVRTTKEYMQKHPESIMWEMCSHDLNRVTGRTAFDAMRRGDKAGQAVVDEYIDYLARGIANIINILQPEVFSIGGGISNERDTLLQPLVKAVQKQTFDATTNLPKTKICIAELRNDAGIVGAAMLGVNA